MLRALAVPGCHRRNRAFHGCTSAQQGTIANFVKRLTRRALIPSERLRALPVQSHIVSNGEFTPPRQIDIAHEATGRPARGKRFEINGMDVIRVRNDFLIGDVRHVEEFAALRAQIAA